jgi:hypothetical protein
MGHLTFQVQLLSYVFHLFFWWGRVGNCDSPSLSLPIVWDDRPTHPTVGFKNSFPELVLNWDPSDLSLPSRQDYRHEPLMPGYICCFVLVIQHCSIFTQLYLSNLSFFFHDHCISYLFIKILISTSFIFLEILTASLFLSSLFLRK